jgi:hypothetical protein
VLNMACWSGLRLGLSITSVIFRSSWSSCANPSFSAL